MKSWTRRNATPLLYYYQGDTHVFFMTQYNLVKEGKRQFYLQRSWTTHIGFHSHQPQDLNESQHCLIVHSAWSWPTNWSTCGTCGYPSPIWILPCMPIMTSPASDNSNTIPMSWEFSHLSLVISPSYDADSHSGPTSFLSAGSPSDALQIE